MSGEMTRILCSGSPVISAYSVRCACGACVVHQIVEPAAHLVHVGHRAAGLQRRGMHPGIEHVLGDDHVSRGEHVVGGFLVASRPVEDPIARLAVQIVADQRGARIERGARVDDSRQRFVLDVDQFKRVAGRVPVPRDHERDLLALEPDLVGREDGLHVGGQGGHPGEVPPGERLPRDHGLDAGVRLRRHGVDRADPRVRQRTAQDRAVEHARQYHVVHEGALAAQEPGVLFARH